MIQIFNVFKFFSGLGSWTCNHYMLCCDHRTLGFQLFQLKKDPMADFICGKIMTPGLRKCGKEMYKKRRIRALLPSSVTSNKTSLYMNTTGIKAKAGKARDINMVVLK